MVDMTNTWLSYIKKRIKVYLIGVALIFLWAVLIWIAGQGYGDQLPLSLDWRNYLEWTVLFLMVNTSNFTFKKLVSEENFISKAYYIGISSFLGCLVSGILIGFYFMVLAPLWGNHFDVNVTVVDIVFPVYLTHLITYTFIGFFVAIYFMQTQIISYRNHLELKLSQAESEGLKNTNQLNELRAVQAKVNPHFLYNSLNSIAALIRSKSDKSEDMVIALSKLFRYHILPNQASFSTLEQEFDILETYLDIEKIRFGEQLSFTISLAQDCKHYKIPRLLLQPLVENAIKHGTSKVEAGSVILSAKKEGDGLALEVTDNGHPFSSAPSSGNGLTTVAKMLQLHYPNNHQFEIISSPTKKVFIKIPLTK